jgi:hypothetical protein
MVGWTLHRMPGGADGQTRASTGLQLIWLDAIWGVGDGGES